MEIDLDTTTTPKFVEIVKCHDRYLLEYGGGGSGKSYRIAQKKLLRIMKAVKQGYQEGFLCLRKTSPDVKRSVFALFKKYIDLWQIPGVKINRSDLSYTFPGGSFIACGGLDDPEKVKSIENITGIWMEEGTQFTYADFLQLDLRLRGDTPSYKQICISFNPMDDTSWIRDEFFDSEKAPKLKIWNNGNSFKTKNATVIQSTWRDNPFVDDQYKEMLASRKETDPQWWNIYDQGLWTALLERIYINYEETTEWPEHFDEVIYGMDFGHTNPTALLEIGFKDGEIYERELIYETEMQNAARIKKLEELEISPYAFIYADPSEPEFIEEIYEAGFNIKPANNKVNPGIDCVITKRPKILSSSRNHLEEKRRYKRKVDRNGHVKEDPVKENDHLQDAERYALYTYFKELDQIPQVLGML
jgi:phage terminase large subunit